MSFGGGGFGGFGQQQNNNQQAGGFGGFGQNNNASSGFGSGTAGGFGQTNNNTNNASGGLFGGGAAAAGNTGGGFGSSTGGAFGSNTGGAFGSKFGSTATTTGGGMFGSNTANTNTGTSGFGGGFGGTNTAANNASPFGGGSTSTGLFGGANNANKPAFGGAATTTGNSLFGGGATNTATTSGFGAGGGFGATNTQAAAGDPPGTAVTPFQAHTEKESPTSSQTNAFQNLLFQDPYKKWSGDELRLADYAQGRRHGNASGGGAFGVNSGFGNTGFGSGTTQNTAGSGLFGGNANANTNTNTGSGLFGSNNATNTGATGFGQSTTGFGTNNATNNAAGTSSGLFGAKPAGNSLFGNNQTQQTQQGGFGTGTGGGFGAGANAGTGFGTGAAAGGNSLFGGNNAANKPQGTGLFGGASSSTGTGFGGATNTGFGTNTANTGGSSLFGNNNQQQQQPAGSGLFGNNNQQQQQPNTGSGFGGFGQQTQSQNQQTGGTGLFGNNQQKPAGSLFGTSTTATQPTGLFGNNNNQQQPQQNSTFGSNNAAAGGTGLFGAKPAASNGLFGAANNQAAGTGTGLFGNANNQQNQNQNQQAGGTGMFGGANANQQQKPGLFGASTQNTGTGLFGAQNNQNQGNSLFGNSANQQQQGQGMGNSLLGASQQANNAPQGLTANLNDVSAFGSPSLFSSVGGSDVANPGPIATPVNGNSKPKRGSILPLYKLAPSSASRFATPQKRGFGFSYSTYGTPGGSPASSIASTPGTGRSLLGSSSSGALSKSMSTNNLRRNFNTEDSILAPGAFSSSSGPRWYGSTGSKKLVISRDMRSDLFSTPQKDKQLLDSNTSSRKLSKRVSFDTSNVENGEQPEIRGALPAPESSPATQMDDTPRQNRAIAESSGSLTPEADKSAGELARVEEEDNAATPSRASPGSSDYAPGAYWTTPTLEELQDMNRMQRQKIDKFVIGRDNVGSISFLYPVDISGIEIDDICGTIIQLEPRSATVYPITAKKPPVGKGLNVPARITLEQSWPRGNRDRKVASDAKKLRKHVDRLRKIPDTAFENYDMNTGIWVFTVEHFTTYGLDDSDDDSDADMTGDALPDHDFTESQQLAMDASVNSYAEDDTFHFRRSRGLPGAFDEQEQMLDEDLPPMQPSFLGVSSVGSAPDDVRLPLEFEQPDEMGDEYDMSDDEDLTRSLVGQHHATEHDDVSSEGEQEDAVRGTPGGILRARMRAMKDSAAPVHLEVADGDDWTEMLRKTVSPAKRDRQLLKEMNDMSPSRQTGQAANAGQDAEANLRQSSWKKSTANQRDRFAANSQIGMDKGHGFATSIDLMNSLFEKPKPVAQNLRASTATNKGFPKVGVLIA